MKKIMFFMALILSVIFLVSCVPNDLENNIPDNEVVHNTLFDISGAVAITTKGEVEEQTQQTYETRNGIYFTKNTSSNVIYKITDEGSLTSILNVDEEIDLPNIAFISVGDDDSLYIAFESMFAYNNGDRTINMQFVRVFQDNSYSVIWPIDFSNFEYDQGLLDMWSWEWGNREPIIKKNGNIYFKVAYNGKHNIYKYNIEENNQSELLTPNFAVSIDKFDIDTKDRVYIKGTSQKESGESASFLRVTNESGSFYPNAIYYTSTNSKHLYDFVVDPVNDLLYMIGNNLNSSLDDNSDGIMKVDINDGDFIYSNISPDFDANNISIADGGDNTDFTLFTYGDITLIPDSTEDTKSLYLEGYAWKDIVTGDDGVPIKEKVLERIRGLYSSEPEFISEEKWEELRDLDLSTITEDLVSEEGSREFLNKYISGTLFKDWDREHWAELGYGYFDYNKVEDLYVNEEGDVFSLGIYSQRIEGTLYNHPRLVKIIDNGSKLDLKTLDTNRMLNYPTQFKYKDEKVFFSYSEKTQMDIMESNLQSIASLDLFTGEENVYDIFNKGVEIYDYDVTDDGKYIYITGYMWDESKKGVIKYNTSTNTYHSLPFVESLNSIKVF